MGNDDNDSLTCPACGHTVLMWLGTLGNLTYLRCRACAAGIMCKEENLIELIPTETV